MTQQQSAFTEEDYYSGMDLETLPLPILKKLAAQIEGITLHEHVLPIIKCIIARKEVATEIKNDLFEMMGLICNDYNQDILGV